MSDDHEPTTEELRIEQLEKERAESALAEDAGLPDDERAHERRADKAAYLREKLEDQQAADDGR